MPGTEPAPAVAFGSPVDFPLLAAALASEPDLVAAWVFGSGGGGQLRPGGDLDLGLLFAGPPVLEALLGLRGRLQRALNVEEIDLVPLNQASPILRFEALCGRRILCRDAGAVAEFASLAAREYEDEMGQLEAALARRGFS